MVDVESDDDDEPPVVGAAVEGLPEADAEMSDGAAPAVEVKNDSSSASMMPFSRACSNFSCRSWARTAQSM